MYLDETHEKVAGFADKSLQRVSWHGGVVFVYNGIAEQDILISPL